VNAAKIGTGHGRSLRGVKKTAVSSSGYQGEEGKGLFSFIHCERIYKAGVVEERFRTKKPKQERGENGTGS